MPRSPDEVVSYYQWKATEFDAKYSMNHITHIHTGHYDPNEHPQLFRAGWISPNLGRERIQFLMYAGQDKTVTNLISSAICETMPRTILDCGAGHGGTALILAERYGAAVDALTISPEQATLIQSNATSLGLHAQVHPLVGDVLSMNGFSHPAYDLITGIDAFCQIGNPRELFSILRTTQNFGSILAISDYFASAKDGKLVERFNDYWRSDITRLADTISALESCGYRLVRLTDTTRQQLPFWELSIAYASTRPPNLSDRRISQSKSFHQLLHDSFQDGGLSYYQLICAAR